MEDQDVEAEDEDASSRPNGKKSAKYDAKMLQSTVDMAKSGKVLAQVAKAKLEDTLRRTSALNRMANHAIMSVEIEKLSATARAFYELEQARIVKEIRNELPGTSSNDDDVGTEGNASNEN